MTALRSRLDVSLVLEVDGKAVQYDFFTTLRDQLEMLKRYPKINEQPNEAPVKLVYVAALRTKAIEPEVTFDDFVDLCLDLQIDEAPPLARGQASQDS